MPPIKSWLDLSPFNNIIIVRIELKADMSKIVHKRAAGKARLQKSSESDLSEVSVQSFSKGQDAALTSSKKVMTKRKRDDGEPDEDDIDVGIAEDGVTLGKSKKTTSSSTSVVHRDAGKRTKIAANDTAVTNRRIPTSNIGKKTGLSSDLSDVIYLGHIPHGFFEVQLKSFFKQFGIVRKVKLFRSPKTGGSRGFAFIQFESIETAQIVAEAMHGYILHDRQLVSHIILKSKHHDGMWKMKRPTAQMVAHNESHVKESIEDDTIQEDPAVAQTKNELLMKRLLDKQNRLNQLGFDYQIPLLSAI